MTGSAVLVKNLNLSYGKNKVLGGVNLEISQGDFVCVVGANGSGKSTLVKAILGLVPPTSGKIKLGTGFEKNSIGYLPQEPQIERYFPATVFEVVLSGALGNLRGRIFYRKTDKKKTLEILTKLNIEKLKDQSFSELSGGQKQKVLLARALTATSNLLVLDEPSNNLDHKSRESFYKILKDLNKAGMTIVMITHDLDADDLIGNKIIAIKEGRAECYKTRDYLRSFR